MLVPAVGTMFLVAFLFTALGTWFATMLADFQGFQLILNILVMPMFFLSGAMFPLDTVPRALQVAAVLDPLAYGVDAFRALLVGPSHFGIGLDFAVLGVLTTAILVLGAWAFSRMEA